MFGLKYRKLLKEQQKQFAEVEFEISRQNELYRALFDLIKSGQALGKDSKMKEYVSEGYEGNADIFSIVQKLGGMFARVPKKLVIERPDGSFEDAEDPDFSRVLKRPNHYQTFDEFEKTWAIFNYITGEAIVYAPRLPAGMNRGRLTSDGLLFMPSQNVEIKAGGWRDPVGDYYLDLDERYQIEKTDVWHTRFAPTLTFTDGKNFRGTSPLRVAREIINSQNAGYELTSKLYKHQHPPGIVSKESEGGDETTAEQESKFRQRYKTKYQGLNNFTVPIFTLGKVNYTKIAYDNLKDLQVIDMSQHGRRIFCNLLQVPSELFGDKEKSTYNNVREAGKAIYTHRIMPDVQSFCMGLTEIARAYNPAYRIIPDYSGVEELQDDKKAKVEWVSRMFNDGAITGDDYLEMLGMERTDLPEMQRRYITANKIPMDDLVGGGDEQLQLSDEFYQANNINDKL